MTKQVLRMSFCLLAFQLVPVYAGTIPGLFNTGVVNNGTDAAGGSTDLHYISQTPSPLNSVFVLTVINGSWIPNSASSQWIGPDTGDGSSINGGNYTADYRLTFDLTGFDTSTAVITGRFAADNSSQLAFNGIFTAFNSPGFNTYTNFTISSGFAPGSNHLDFIWTNSGGPGGLRVDNLSGTANALTGATPEPSTFGLLALGGLALGLIGKRRLAR